MSDEFKETNRTSFFVTKYGQQSVAKIKDRQPLPTQRQSYATHGLRMGAPSLRAYRTLADNLLARAAVGEISWTEAKAGIAAIHQSASMFLGERMMKANGVPDVAETHELGPLGGIEIEDAIVTPTRKRTRKQRAGVDPHGNPVRVQETVEETTEPEEDSL